MLATSKTYAPEQLPGPASLRQVVVKGKNKIHVKEPTLYHSRNTQVAHLNKGSI